jgi:hypothetical protein
LSDDKEQAGIGKVIYSVDDKNGERKPAEKRAENAEVEEADAESFPASDPPGFAGGKSSEPDATEQ